MKKYFLLILTIACFSGNLSAQLIRFGTNVKQDTSETDFGKNRKNYVTFTMQYGMFTQSDKTFNQYGSSSFAFSILYQHKLSNWYSYGFDFAFNFSGFQMTKKQENKTFPDTIMHNKENISISSFGVELYQRFNFFNKHRGEILGKYLDMGVYGNIHISSMYYYRDTHNRSISNFFTKKNDVYFRNPDFLNIYDYGVSARIGINWFSVFARYRLSELMKSSYKKDYAYPEMPNLVAGIRFVF